jgi:hypothetical protein
MRVELLVWISREISRSEADILLWRQFVLEVKRCSLSTNCKKTYTIFRAYDVKYLCGFDVRKSMHHHTIQITQPTRCSNFTSLLLDVYVWLNIFRAPPHHQERKNALGASGCTVGALLVVVCQTTTNNAPTTTLQPPRSNCRTRGS